VFNIVVSKGNAVPIHVAVASVASLPVAVFLDYVLNGVELGATVLGVDSDVFPFLALV